MATASDVEDAAAEPENGEDEDPFAALGADMWDDDADGDQDEEVDDSVVADEREHAQETLQSIFDYYAVQSSKLQEPKLTSARLIRMALDANLIDSRLTHAKVDLAYHRICGATPHMTLQQFLDAIVRMSVTKFPDLDKQEAVMELYRRHLSSFSGPSNGAVSQLPEGALAVAAAARKGLLLLYESYLINELRPQEKRPRNQSETQNSFVKLFMDFEVIPELAAKSIAYAVFREVAALRKLPATVRDGVLDGTRNRGRNFTYAHFATAVVLMAQRSFAEDGPAAVVRLLEWMDASKGRQIVMSNFPGNLPSGGLKNFRIMPSVLPEEQLATMPPDLQRRNSNNSDPAQRAIALEAAMAAESKSSEGIGKVAPWAKKIIQQIFGHYAALGDPLNRSSLSSQKFQRFLRDAGMLSSEAGGSRSQAGSQVGTPGSITPGRSHSVCSAASGFVPPPRDTRLSLASVQSKLAAAQAASGGGRSNSVGSLKGKPSLNNGPVSGRGSVAATDSRRNSGTINFSVSASKAAASGSGQAADGEEDEPGLPLKIFEHAPLNQVDADLIYLQAVRETESSTQGAGSSSASGGRRPSSSAGSPAGGISVGKKSTIGGVRRSHMTADGFQRGIADVATRCMESSSKLEALHDFCRKVLEPLAEILLNLYSQEVASAAEFVDDAEGRRFLSKCRPGLEKVYQLYVQEPGGARPHWNSDSIARFAQEFDLITDVRYMPLQKILQNCTHYESCRGRGVAGELSYNSFEVVLVLIAQKMASSQAGSDMDKLTHLFTRMNLVACTPAMSNQLNILGDLLPVPRHSTEVSGTGSSTRTSFISTSPSQAAKTPTSSGSGSGTFGTGRPDKIDKRPSTVELSWAEVMADSM